MSKINKFWSWIVDRIYNFRPMFLKNWTFFSPKKHTWLYTVNLIECDITRWGVTMFFHLIYKGKLPFSDRQKSIGEGGVMNQGVVQCFFDGVGVKA